MNTKSVLQKSWQMLWRYRALWLFGAILALVAANTIFLGSWGDREENDQWLKIKISDYSTLRLPSTDDVTIDLTAPGGVRIISPNPADWRDLRSLADVVNSEGWINLSPILIEFAVILVAMLLLGVIARYVVETAVIRMVNEAEETGKQLSVRKGLQKGFSYRAWRLFLVDLAVGLLAIVAFIVVFGLAASPLLLVINNHELITIAAGVGGLLFLLALAGSLWLAASAVLSLVLQPIRLACVLEDRSLMASIREGFRMAKHHLKDFGLIWLIWMGIRLLWAPVGILVVILLAPVLLLTVLAGVVAGGVPAALVGAFANLFTGGVTPWIMGALVGLPIFTLVTISPILFVSGFVEIYKSCIWTLAYRDLRAVERTVQVPAPQAPMVPSHGVVG